MKTFLWRLSIITLALIAFACALTSCNSLASPKTTPTPTSPTATSVSTLTSEPTITSTTRPTYTRVPPPTATVFVPRPTPMAFLGTSLPENSEPISADNIQQLSYVAQWGRGSIRGVAFAPDGNSFIVGSAFGFAIYDLQKPEAPPRWVPFEPLFFYDSLFFSQNGHYLLLENRREKQIRSYATGRIVAGPSEVEWLKTTTLSENWGEVTVISPDGTRRLEASVLYNQEGPILEVSLREVYDTGTEELLYALPDKTTYVEYKDYQAAEGCDLYTFSYSGNAFDPSALLPYRAGFSPSRESLAILYRAPNLYDSNQFSLLRIYRARDGELLATLGSFKQPVETFAYSPDGRTLVVGLGDGSVLLWDTRRNKNIFNASHFNDAILGLAYSHDGKYLILQRPDFLEIRRAGDGLLQGRYPATAFAASPIENLVAIGASDGTLQLQDLESGRSVYRIQAHDAKIFALEFSPNGRMLVSSGQDCDVRAWETQTGKFLHYFEENSTNAYGESGLDSRLFIYSLNFVPETQQLIGYGSWARVVGWDIDSGATDYLIEPEPLEYYNGMMTLNPHFPEFFDVDLENQRFYINNVAYNLKTGEKTGEYQPPANLPEGCAPIGPISKDGKLIFTIGYESYTGQICVLSAEDFHLAKIINLVPNNQGLNIINWLYLSPDGRQLALTTWSGLVYVYQITL